MILDSYNEFVLLGADGFSGQWLRSTDRIDLLYNLWNNDVLKMLRKSFKVELIPLNKVWPQIPLQDQFRPIAIESAIFKFIELRFLPKLNEYLSMRMDRNQIGFVKNCSCQMNILELILELKKFKSKDKMVCVFIDFKSAYNTVIKQKLFDILRNKQIYDE